MEILKKAISALLALVLVTGMLPVPAFAAEVAEATEPVSVTEAVVLETIPVTTPAETAPTETVPAPEPTVAEAESKKAAIEDELPLVNAGGNPSAGTPDGEPPVLHNVILSTDAVTAPGQIEVIVEASDDVSGVQIANISFCCAETNRGVSVNAEATYWDSEKHERVAYEDGNLHGVLEIDQYTESCTFVLDNISLYDNAGNVSSYRENYENITINGRPCQPLPNGLEALQFTVQESTADGEPPVLHNITLSADTVTAPGQIEVIVEASDDVSGVQSAYIYFECAETYRSVSVNAEATYWDSEKYERVAYEDGNLHGMLEIDQYTESCTFILDEISLYDNAGNMSGYREDYENITINGRPCQPLPNGLEALQFTVQESTADGEPPVLHNIILSADTVTAPGQIEVIVEASDDVSGVQSAYIYFECAETYRNVSVNAEATYWDSEKYERVAYEDGNLHGMLEIDQYTESCTFVLDEISLYDNAGNMSGYREDYENITINGRPCQPLPTGMENLQFRVFNTIPDVTTSVSNPSFIDKLESAEDNAYIVADYSGDATLTEDAFEAIAGTDKTLDLASEGITWRFNGNDITEDIKPIDLKVNITHVEEEGSENGEAIADQLKDNPGVVMKFAENGTLPGKATIQVKVDYAMREYLGSDENLCVYYYNNETGKLELIAEDLKVINDTYVEFSITHCSYYVLAPKLLEEVEEVSWSFDEATNTLHITGDGPMEDYRRKGAPWYDLRDRIFDIEIEAGITYIGEYAFYRCDHVADVTIPASVKGIGSRAYSECDILTRIVFSGSAPDGYVDGYKNCTAYYPEEDTSWTAEARENLNFQFAWIPYEAGTTPEVVTSGSCGDDLTWSFDEASGKLTIIGSGAMEEFNSGAPWKQFRNDILSIQLDDRITYISNSAFEGCSRLRTVNIPKSLKSIDEYGIGGQYAFKDCVSLDCEIVIPDGVMVTAYGMFYDCTSLKDVKLPKNLQTIGGGTFLGCTSLESIQIPNKVTSLNECSFYECTSLKSVKLPDSIEYISGFNFAGCTSLESINIPEGVDMIGFQTFANCTSLKKIELPESVMSISYGAFANCWDLESVKLPNVLEGVNVEENWDLEHAFSGCRSLKEIDLPDNLTIIPEGMFYDCTSLETVDIPETVTEIGKAAFQNCASLKEITFEGNAPEFTSAFNHPLYGKIYNIFPEVEATAYYPANDLTWTEDVRKDYGGKITWVSYTPEGGISGKCEENLNWTLDDAGTLTVTGNGYLKNFGDAFWQKYVENVHKVVVEEGITGIGDSAFPYPNEIREVTLPASALELDHALYLSTKLESITVDPNNPNYVTVDGVLFSKDMTRLIRYPAGKAAVSYDIPKGVQRLEFKSFMDAENLEHVQIPDSVTFLDSNVFLECSALKEIVLPDSITQMGEGIFVWCENLEKVTLSKGLDQLYWGTFFRCIKLKTITIPANIRHIGGNDFGGCDSLKEIMFEGDAPTVGEDNIFAGVTATAYYPADNATWTEDVRKDYGGKITWKPYSQEGVTSGICGGTLTWEFDPETGILTIKGIGEMFDFILSILMKSVNTFNAPNPTVPWAAYQSQIKQVILPEGLTNIGNNAFAGCENLTEITIPKTVTAVGSGAFVNCSGLKEVSFQGNAPEVAENAFENVEATITYPQDDATWTEDKMQDFGGALTWAPETGHEYKLGDVNHDGKINAKDATLILQKSVGVLKPTAKFCEECAEVSGDGKLNAKDSTLILQFSVGLREIFPAQEK